MFKVRDLRNGTVRTVYGVLGPMFIFFIDDKWCIEDATHYVPVEEEDG